MLDITVDDVVGVCDMAVQKNIGIFLLGKICTNFASCLSICEIFSTFYFPCANDYIGDSLDVNNQVKYFMQYIRN